ncbi:ABC transporter B family member 29, chloroplastic [Argentina anserina]|uniref:ABC transporter B family member 29, chloroplastic n=1 Tax=Argentina anserina TaxID=57926 RepID=UPI0021765168|nr:ABC transporter B family member 29, chloroplastic [Potentilla anserina]
MAQRLVLSLIHRPPSPSFSFYLKPKTLYPISTHLNCTHLHSQPPKPLANSPPFNSLASLKPFILSEKRPIILGWLCSLVSVYSLSEIVPKIGNLSAQIGRLDLIMLRNEGLALGVLVLARVVAVYWQQAFLWEAALNAAYQVRVHVWEKVLERDMGFFEGAGAKQTGDVAYRITAEASDVADSVYAVLNTVVPSALQISVMAAKMAIISPMLSGISAAVIPCMALVIAYLGEKLRMISNKAQLSTAALSAYLNEVLPAICFVKASNAELWEKTRFQKLAHTDLCERLEKKKMKALIPQIIQIIYFGGLSMLCIAPMVFCGGSVDISSIVSYVISSIFLIEPIQGVGKAYNELKQGEPAVERLFDLTRFKSMMMEHPNAVDLNRVTGDVKFSDVSFKYGDNVPPILKGLNLHIKPGETLALVGPSGCGKTTLIKLLLRLYDPLSGRILIDNHDIKNLRLASLRSHIGLVSQEITLFSGTITENIGYKDLMTNVNMEMVEAAARTANADEFIKKLPEGYNTNIGPRGSTLSGGQKQRLAIARALYHNSSILILDEATSALDSRSEILVRQAVESLMENHTVLVIAHRLETVLMAKRVFLLKDGKLEELTHSDLLSGQHVSMGLVT